MLLLTVVCLVGTALAAPATPEETMTPAESHVLVSPYIPYSAPLLPLRMMIRAEPMEEKAELPETKEELSEEPKEELAITELPKLEEFKPVLVNDEPSKPLSYFTNWINTLPSLNLPSLPPFISSWFPSSSNPKFLLPAYPAAYPAAYPGYPGAVIVEAAKR